MVSEASKQIRARFVQDKEKQALSENAAPVSLEIARKQWEESALRAALPAGTDFESVIVQTIHCEWVRSADASKETVLLFLHGGGFSAGSCITHREMAARISLASGISILTVDYRLAPEHPFPAGVEDSVTVYQWLLEHHTPEQLFVIGDSAGSAVAMSTLLMLRERGIRLPHAAILISPWLDLALIGETMVTRRDVDLLTTEDDLKRAAAAYAGDTDLKNPMLSPVYADLTGLPPMLIQVGDHEILLSDTIRLAENAKKAGIDVTLEVWEKMWHVWHGWAAELPEGQQAIDRIGEYIRGKMSDF